MSSRAPTGSRAPAGARTPGAVPPIATARRVGGSRRSRLVWGGAATLLGVLLVVSTSMARGAVSHEEQTATDRAASLAEDVLFPALTPTLVSRPILGDDYKNLLTVIQGGVLDDQWVLRLRIWRPDGTLVFSTDRRDRVGQAFGMMRERVKPVVQGSGETLVRVTGETVSPRVGLAGSTEQLFETYFPVRLSDAGAVLGAAEFDTRYEAIDHAANRVWRPVQIALSIALAFCLVSLVLSLRSRTVGRAAGFEPASRGDPTDRVLEAERRRAEGRVQQAEEAMREAQARLSASEETVKKVAAASRTLEDRLLETERRIPELEAALARSREELMHARQQPPADVTRIQAELQKSYERLQVVEVELKQAAERARQAEERLSESEVERARLQADLAGAGEELEAARARGLDVGQLREVEARLRKTEEALAGREADLHLVAERALRAEEALAAKELETRRTAEQAEQAEERARHAEQQVRETEERAGEAGQRAREMEERLRLADVRLREAEADRLALAGRVDSLQAAPSDEIQRLEGQLRLAEEQLRRADESLAGREAELRQSVEHARHLEERLAQSGADRGPTAGLEEMQARLEQGEADRQRLAGDLFRTQEKLANREFELAQALKRVQEPEGGRAGSESLPEPAPEAPSSLGDGSRPADGPETDEGALEGEPPDEEDPARSEEAESLRSRLTRAAAMRHGGAYTSPPSGAKPR